MKMEARLPGTFVRQICNAIHLTGISTDAVGTQFSVLITGLGVEEINGLGGIFVTLTQARIV